MRILKHGNLKPRKFICQSCGCEFIAEAHEYSTTMANGIILWHTADCPDCANSTTTSELWDEEDG